MVASKEALGELIAQRRKALGLDRRDLALELHCSVERIGQIERGVFTALSVEQVAGLADLLDLSTNRILREMGHRLDDANTRDDDEVELLKLFRALPQDGRAWLLATLPGLLGLTTTSAAPRPSGTSAVRKAS